MVLFDIFKAWENLYCIIIIIHFNCMHKGSVNILLNPSFCISQKWIFRIFILDWIISLKKNKQEEIIVHKAEIFTAKMKSYLH